MSPVPDDDLLVLDADVRTMDPRAPRARAFAVRRGRITCVGDPLVARAAASPGARVLSAAGRVVTPGLIDAHTHLVPWARARGRLSLAGIGSLDEALARVSSAHAHLASGARLVGEDVPPFGAWGRLPTRADLDRVAPGRGVVLFGRDRHAAWTSSATLAESGITRDTPDPAGGAIAHDAQGEPTGLIYETALELLGGTDEAADLDGLAAAVARLGEVGITAVHDFGERASWDALAALRADGRLAVRVAFGFMPRADGAAADLPGPLDLAADERLWPFALKGFVDGTLGSRTAWMLEPFADGAGSGIARLDGSALDAFGA
ncbi:MAG: amidohydrolase family protein, partial [Candidatus Eisenbacteria bacterium]